MRRVVAGTGFHVEGITDDGWVVYDDGATANVFAVFLGGGNPIQLAGIGLVRIVGNVVWVRPGDLSDAAIFTGATGVHRYASGSNRFAASDDGTRMVVDLGGNGIYDLVEVSPDLSNQKPLLSSDCADVVSVGSGFVTWSCGLPPHLDSWDLSGKGTPLALAGDTALAGIAYDHGMRVFAAATGADGGYTVQAMPLDGGAPTVFVSGLTSPLSDAIAVTPDGARLVFTSSLGVSSTPTSSPNPVPLVGTPSGEYTFSSDGKWMTIRMAGSGSGPVLYPYALASTTTGGEFFAGDADTPFIGPFTDDAKYVAVFRNDAGSIVSFADFSATTVPMKLAYAIGGSRLAYVGDVRTDAGSPAQMLAVLAADNPDAAVGIAVADPTFAPRQANLWVSQSGSGRLPSAWYRAISACS